MFSIFKIFKKKKIVPHIRLSGVIGAVGKFKQGLDFVGQKEIIEKAFSIKMTPFNTIRAYLLYVDPEGRKSSVLYQNPCSTHFSCFLDIL